MASLKTIPPGRLFLTSAAYYSVMPSERNPLYIGIYHDIRKNPTKLIRYTFRVGDRLKLSKSFRNDFWDGMGVSVDLEKRIKLLEVPYRFKQELMRLTQRFGNEAAKLGFIFHNIRRFLKALLQ